MNQSSSTARTLVNELISFGVREAVLCPGSRNAPLSFALLAAAEIGAIHLHVRIDERSAAFLAMGLALASGKPVPICVTSGTAVANLLPAFVEANYSNVPLVILSANRDLIYRDSGVGQIIEQDTLFSHFARYEAHIPTQIDAGEVQKIIQESLYAAMNPERSGPIHLDIAFAEPLVPEENSLQEMGILPGSEFSEQDILPADLQNVRRIGSSAMEDIAPQGVDRIYELDLSQKILLVMGAVSASVWARLDASVRDLCEILPATAEPMSIRPRYYIHPLAVRDIQPELVIVVGRPTLHREVLTLLQNPRIRVLSVPTPLMYAGLPGEVQEIIDKVSLRNVPDSTWVQQCVDVSARTEQSINRVIGQFTDVTGLTVAAAIAQAKHKYTAFFLGASNPIRDMAIMAGPLGSQVDVFANRGASGIDGSMATAMGIAYISGPTLAFIGDLTFVHDMGALLIGNTEVRPESLTIVIPNDQGGGIFSLLEQGDAKYNSAGYGAGAERIFQTPHSVNIGQICCAMHIDYFSATSATLLELLLQDFSGIRVIEVPCARENLRHIHQMMRDSLVDGILDAE